MAVADFSSAWTELDRALRSIESVIDPDSKRAEIADLAEQVAAPDLWDDQDNAQRVTSRLSWLQNDLERLDGVVEVGRDRNAAERELHGRRHLLPTAGMPISGLASRAPATGALFASQIRQNPVGSFRYRVESRSSRSRRAATCWWRRTGARSAAGR